MEKIHQHTTKCKIHVTDFTRRWRRPNLSRKTFRRNIRPKETYNRKRVKREIEQLKVNLPRFKIECRNIWIKQNWIFRHWRSLHYWKPRVIVAKKLWPRNLHDRQRLVSRELRDHSERLYILPGGARTFQEDVKLNPVGSP